MRSQSFAVLLAFVSCCVAPTANATVTANPLSAPAGFAEGDKFRFLFITMDTISATSSNIADYNSFVNFEANGASYNGATISWNAVVSTASVSARDNVGGYGSNAAIFLVNGTKVANDMTTASGSNGLWSSNLLAAPNVRINGATRNVTVWSGSTGLGLAWNGGLGTSAPAGIATGLSSFQNFQWMNDTLNPKTSYFSIYGLSEELTYSTVPAPGAIALLGAAGLFGRRCRG
jgi:hypothetical protein